MLDNEQNLVFHDFEKKLHCSIISSAPIAGGYLNLKWKLITDKGTYLLKQYSPKRYSQQKIKETESSLHRQTIVRALGVLCPKVFEYNGSIIQQLDEELWYMAMEFVIGELLPRNKVESSHMQSLGMACAQMHKALLTLPVDYVKFQYDYTLDKLLNNYENCLREARESNISEYLRAVEKQKPILESIDDSFFAKIPKGFTHRDFAGDNILFQGNQVSAIIDFDTIRYAYQWQDIGRAVLSFMLGEEGIDKRLLESFLIGYNQHLSLSYRDIIHVLRFIWCAEVSWWIQKYCFQDASIKVKRFLEELLWLTDHWFQLETLI